MTGSSRLQPRPPKIAFIVAAFNAADTLGTALDSVLSQEHTNWEVVVVDDGSTDGTRQVAEGYAATDSRIRVLSQRNAGAGAARNAGLAGVDADYVTYLDADDMLSEHYTTAMLDLMQEYPNRDIYSSDGLFVHPDGTTSRVFGYKKTVSLTIDDLLHECLILGGGALVRADVMRALGGFREHMYGEDYDLWLRALAQGYTHVATPEPLYVYHRCIEGQKSEDSEAGCGSAVVALKDLIDSGLLSSAQQSEARKAIANYVVGPELEVQARTLRRRVERVVGSRWATPAMRAIHSVSWTVRPLRRWLAARRAVKG